MVSRRSTRCSTLRTVPMSVTMPVNMDARLAFPHALVNFEAIDAETLLLDKLPAAMRVGDAVEADIAERGLALTDDDRRAIDEDAVDEILGEERGRRCRPALDEQVIDVMKSGHIARRMQGFPAVNSVAAGEEGATRGPVLDSGQPYVEAGGVGEIGAPSDKDHVGMGALDMDVAARVFPGDPFRFAGRQRDLAVD